MKGVIDFFRRNQTVKSLFIGAGLYVFFVAIFSNPVADYDLWGYLAFGRIFWEEGYFPLRDPFSYIQTKDVWIYHEWLTGVFFYGLFKQFGPVGLQALRYVLVGLSFFLIYKTAERKGADSYWIVIILIPVGLLISFGYVPVRAQVFTYLFFALTLFVLETAKIKKNWLFLGWLVPVHLLWCNLHGGFVSGLGLIFLYFWGSVFSKEKSLPFLLAWGGASLVTLINPYGLSYWKYTWEAVSMPRSEITEWLSVLQAIQQDIYLIPAVIFLVMAVMGTFLFGLLNRKDYSEYLVWSLVLLLGIKYIRHTVFFGFIMGAYLPSPLSQGWKRLSTNQFSPWFRRIVIVGLCTIIVIICKLVYSNQTIQWVPTFGLSTPAPKYPTGAYFWIIKNRFQGNILSQFEWGEFLIWYFYPSCRVAFDGRYETVYSQSVSREYFQFLQGKEEGKIFLERYPHQMVLLRTKAPANRLVQSSGKWYKVYEDETCVLYLPRKPRYN